MNALISPGYRTGTISFERIKMALSKYQTNGDDMGDIKLIEKQIEGLDDKAFAELAAWFADYENSRWDRQIEADSYAGKFDAFMEEALTEHRNGKTAPL